MNCQPNADARGAPHAAGLLLLDDTDLAVLDEPADNGTDAAAFGAAERSALCELLVDDHRFAPALAAVVCRELVVAVAGSRAPDGDAVAALSRQLVARHGRRLALDRGTATCLAVAVVRRLARAGLAATGLGAG